MTAATTRKLLFIALILGLSVWSMLANEVVLGLDLQGGVTMRYELEPPDTAHTTDPAAIDSMIDSTVETLRQRIDAYGIKESGMARQGSREVVIELPGKGKDEAETIKSVISRVGRLEFRIVASDDARTGLSVADERAKLAELLKANAGKGADEIDVTPLDRKFNDVLFRWVPYGDKLIAERRGAAHLTDLSTGDDAHALLASHPLDESDYLLLRFETSPDRTFTGADIENAAQSQDGRGTPAVGIQMRPGRGSLFGDFTEPNKGQALAIVLDGRVPEHAATINDRLDTHFVIQSGAPTGFSSKEIRDYLTIIRSGSLQMKPRLLYENTIGPQLGETAIAAGVNASVAGLVIVVVFMLAYYRWHGVHATITLVCNCMVLAGILMLLGATVTLPGLAGLILTFGIAVDANILIYERMREERDRAKSPAQVIKLGFEKALPTILDSHVTAFITSLVLYKLGTGPVRGFAVVLMLGLITSIWSAVVVGQTIYHALLDMGKMKTIGTMARWVRADTHIGFMRIGFACLRASALLVVVSIVSIFIANPDKLYGLDFLGGYKAQVRLSRLSSQGEIKELVDRAFPGTDAQVVSIADDQSTTAGQSHQFEVKVKGKVRTEKQELSALGSRSLADEYENPMKQALSGLLLPDFVTDLALEEDAAAATTKVSGVLHFESPPDAGKVAAHLGLLGQLQSEPAGADGVKVSGVMPGTGLQPQVVAQRLKLALEDAADVPKPSTPLVESTTIGARVGTELRDSALRAILISFIGIVLYLRVRFHEFRYGFAAVIALIHDTAIVLGVVVLVNQLGWLDIELDLAMIAAFLTIIGYSMNDTIVLFDRVRENLPRTKAPLYEVIDASMNQVLARSLLTSFTVMLTLIVIFVMNIGKRNVLEGFSFCMLVGVIVGTYSSIYVASPFLLIFSSRGERDQNNAARGVQPKGEVAA